MLNACIFRLIEYGLTSSCQQRQCQTARAAKADTSTKSVNIEIMLRMQDEGTAVLSDTTVQNEHCLRVAINNHRTTRSDLGLLVAEIVRLGDGQKQD